MGRESVATALGWIFGLATAVGALFAMLGAGAWIDLPSGRYPVVLLALIFAGLPLVVGFVCGCGIYLISFRMLAPLDSALSSWEKKRAGSGAGAETANSLFTPSRDIADARRKLSGEIGPALRRAGLALHHRLPDGSSLLHKAARSGDLAMLEVLGEQGLTTIWGGPSRGGTFLDVARLGRSGEVLSAFMRGFMRVVENDLKPADRPVTPKERDAIERWIGEIPERMRRGDRDSELLLSSLIIEGPLKDARLLRGIEARDSGRFAEAIQILTSVLRLDPANHHAYVTRGVARRGLGQITEAIEDFTNALKVSPQHFEAIWRRGKVYEAAGNKERALADFDSALKMDPKHVGALIDRGALHYSHFKHAMDALADFRYALALEPSNELARQNIEAVLIERNADNASIARYTAAIEDGPTNVRMIEQRGYAHRVRGELDASLRDLDEAIRLEPENPTNLFQRGLVLIDKGEHQRALRDYEALARLTPDNADVHRQIGWLHDREGRRELAIAAYREALRIRPGDRHVIAVLERHGASA